MVISMIVYFLSACYMFFLLFARPRKKIIGAREGLIFGIAFYYAIVPFLILASVAFGSNNMSQNTSGYVSRIINADTVDHILTNFMVIIFVSIFELIYRAKRTNKVPVDRGIDLKYRRISSVLFCISSVSFLIFIIAIGGVERMLSVAEIVRHPGRNVLEFMPYYASLLIIPAGWIVLVAPLVNLANIEEKQVGRAHSFMEKIANGFMYIFSVFLSILYYLYKAGRAPLLIYLIALFFPFVNKRTKHPWKFVLIVGCLSLPLLDVLGNLFNALAGWTNFTVRGIYDDFNVMKYYHEFAYPASTLLNIFDITEKFGIRFGADFITDILNFMPGLQFGSAYEVVSEFYAGTNWKSVGITPADLISLAIIEFHVLGIIILPIALATIIRRVDLALATFRDKTGQCMAVNLTIVSMFWLVSTADVSSLIALWIPVACPAMLIMKYKMERLQ